MSHEDARRRLGLLGLDDDAVATLVDHFEDAERRGKAGHGLSRIDWLETVSFDERYKLLISQFELAGSGAPSHLRH